MKLTNQIKRLLSALLIFVLVFSLVPVDVFAASDTVDAAIFFSDLHSSKSDSKTSQTQKIMNAVAKSGLDFSSVVSCGDVFSSNSTNNFGSLDTIPFTKILFPNLKKNGEAMGAIVMNITANMLGMSNAATPLGIRAMEKLQKENQGRKKASHEMCTFVLINTASVQIIPTTLIALRSASGSAEPTKIIVPIWITSILVLCTALISAKILKIFSER